MVFHHQALRLPMALTSSFLVIISLLLIPGGRGQFCGTHEACTTLREDGCCLPEALFSMCSGSLAAFYDPSLRLLTFSGTCDATDLAASPDLLSTLSVESAFCPVSQTEMGFHHREEEYYGGTLDSHTGILKALLESIQYNPNKLPVFKIDSGLLGPSQASVFYIAKPACARRALQNIDNIQDIGNGTQYIQVEIGDAAGRAILYDVPLVVFGAND